jgi:hypothetical protein
MFSDTCSSSTLAPRQVLLEGCVDRRFPESLQVRAEELLTLWQAQTGVPFGSLDNKLWHLFTSTLRADFKAPSRHTLERRLDVMYHKMVQRLHNRLASVKYVAVAMDGWGDHQHMETLGMTLIDLENPESVYLWCVEQQAVRQTAANVKAWVETQMARYT